MPSSQNLEITNNYILDQIIMYLCNQHDYKIEYHRFAAHTKWLQHQRSSLARDKIQFDGRTCHRTRQWYHTHLWSSLRVATFITITTNFVIRQLPGGNRAFDWLISLASFNFAGHTTFQLLQQLDKTNTGQTLLVSFYIAFLLREDFKKNSKKNDIGHLFFRPPYPMEIVT